MLTGQHHQVGEVVVEDAVVVAHNALVTDVGYQNHAVNALNQVAVAPSAKDFLGKSPQKLN